jgi:hypothetical protein
MTEYRNPTPLPALKGLMELKFNHRIRMILFIYYSRKRVDSIVRDVWRRYSVSLSTIPKDEKYTVGARYNHRHAALTIALHDSLVAAGQTKERAFKIISDILWLMYTRWARLAWLLSGLVTRDPYKRIKFCTELFRSYPFGPPSYRWEDVEAGEGVLAHNCLRCPIAEYFASQGQSELCANTWCKLDYPLLHQWGGELEERTTIADGADHCTFRIRVVS